MPKPLLLAGFGGFAGEVAQTARRIDPDGKRWSIISYVAPSEKDKGTKRVFGTVDYCDDELVGSDLTADVVIAVGDPGVRAKLAAHYASAAAGFSFPNLIHPDVYVDQTLVRLGRGNVIGQGAILTCGITAGNFNIFNKGCMIGHDVTIGSCNVINPMAAVAGGSRLGDGCLIGIGARVLEGRRVADRTMLGAGSVLVSDVGESGQSFFGVPARRLR